MLKRSYEQGIRHVVATPHFYPQHNNPERFLKRRYEAEQRLREEMSEYDDLPELSVGAEVYYFSKISESDILQGLTIGKNRCILLEMSNIPWTDSMFRDIEDIKTKQGLVPIIAHIDRYISPFRTFGIPKRLEGLPAYVQANANFFLRPSTKGMALRMLKNNQVHLLGSDCHNLTSRPPNLGEAVKVIDKKFGPMMIDKIGTYQNEVLNH